MADICVSFLRPCWRAHSGRPIGPVNKSSKLRVPSHDSRNVCRRRLLTASPCRQKANDAQEDANAEADQKIDQINFEGSLRTLTAVPDRGVRREIRSPLDWPL
jgi:hypothetical protein